MNFMTMDIKYIAKWCQDNNKVEWLKKKATEKVEYKVYPKIKVPALDKDGNVILTKKGKVKMVSVADKSKEPVVKKDKISFVQIKKDFCAEFMPELLPKAKDKEPNMYDFIASL